MKPSDFSLYDLHEKTAVVTGGAFAGARVAVLDVVTEAADTLAADIRTEGNKAIGVTCDVLDKESIAASSREILKGSINSSGSRASSASSRSRAINR